MASLDISDLVKSYFHIAALSTATSSISLPPQPPLAEDPIGILPGITQFLSQQLKTLIHIPEPTDAPEIIEAAGFRSEVHKVTTDDGYILTMHR